MPAHDRQAAGVGRRHDDRLSLDFDQHPAQGVARAFGVGREHRPPDHLFEQTGRHADRILLVELGDVRELGRVLGPQFVLCAVPADHRSRLGRFQIGRVSLHLPQDRQDAIGRQEHLAGGLDGRLAEAIADPHLLIGPDQHRLAV